MATKRDYYEILGLSKTATPAEIKAAYRKLALQYHPDRNKASDAEEKFKEINEAYQVIGDKEKRKTYDQFGHSAFDPSAGMGGNPFAGGAQQGPFTYTYSYGGGNPFGGASSGDFGDPFQIFESFFGGNPFSSRQQRRPRYSMTLPFMEAVKGVEKTVEIDGKRRSIKIPAGVDDGTRIRFDEFDVTIDVQPHTTFQREGADIYADAHIDLITAILGGVVTVETIDEKLELKIRPGTQSHTMIRLRERGIKHLRSSSRGDHYVRIIIDIPERISRKQRTLLEEFRNA